MKIAICYANEQLQRIVEVELPVGSTVIQAILASGTLDQEPSLKLSGNVGIYSKKVALDTVLNDGDRIEIYRPLKLTPNELRLLRKKKS